MTNKEFEDKKQEIADYIEHNFRLDGNPKMDNTHKYVIKSVNAQKLVSMINGLQLPKPPACSTCKHTVPIYNMFKSKILWRECKKVKLFKSSVGNATELPTRGWGCTRHSDYEAAK